jgi:hypothetical protein
MVLHQLGFLVGDANIDNFTPALSRTIADHADRLSTIVRRLHGRHSIPADSVAAARQEVQLATEAARKKLAGVGGDAGARTQATALLEANAAHASSILGRRRGILR